MQEIRYTDKDTLQADRECPLRKKKLMVGFFAPTYPKFAPAYTTSYIPRIDPHSGAYHEKDYHRRLP